MAAPKTPIHPRLILAAALIPGFGHVLLGEAPRGLMFLFFTAILGWLSLRLMPEQASFLGRHAGGVVVYGLSVLDAYRIASYRYHRFHAAQKETNLAVDVQKN